jgi:hypothetical protein
MHWALRHIDSLKEDGHTKIGAPVEMFGRAHVIGGHLLALYDYGSTFSTKRNKLVFFHMESSRTADGKTEGRIEYEIDAPPLPLARHGEPVDQFSRIVTEDHAALLLFQEGGVVHIPPYRMTLSTLVKMKAFLDDKAMVHGTLERLKDELI